MRNEMRMVLSLLQDKTTNTLCVKIHRIFAVHSKNR